MDSDQEVVTVATLEEITDTLTRGVEALVGEDLREVTTLPQRYPEAFTAVERKQIEDATVSLVAASRKLRAVVRSMSESMARSQQIADGDGA